MSRHGKAGRSDRRPPAAEDVISGAVNPSIVQLLRLIHAVNPTGAEVSRTEARNRYALKARLQSHLIRRFEDQIEVVPEAGQPGLVSLQHRSGTRDACHAVVAELDVDARSWVQRRLDQGGTQFPTEDHDAEPTGSTRGAGSGQATEPASVDREVAQASGLVALAQRAVADYDYEAALDGLQQALELPGGARLAARPLLELLVDNLGLDADALALAPRIAAEAADPTVRGLLGLAAARLGRRDEAQRLAKGLGESPAARIHIALARLALGGGDDRTAEGDIAAARHATPGDAEVEAVAAERLVLRAAQRRPAEEALLAAQATGEAQETLAARAAGVLERWPESEVARRVLRVIESESARARWEALFDQAEASLGAGDVREARHLLRTGRALGGDRMSLAEQLEAAEAAVRERQEAEAVAAIARALEETTGEARRAALLRYLTLAPPLRAGVRDRLPLPSLEYLEEAGQVGPPQAIVEAVMALERAEATLAQGAPGAARALLDEHAKALRGVRAHAELQRKLQLAIEQREATASLAALAAAEAAAARGDAEGARQQLAGCVRRHLSEEARGRLRAIEELLGEATAVRDLESRYAAALAAGDLPAARKDATRLATRARESEREGWTKTAEQLRVKIRHAWRVWSIEGEPSVGLNGFAMDMSSETNHWLSEDGRTLVLTYLSGPWIFVREWDVPGCRVRRATALRAPEALAPLLTVRLAGDELWLCTEAGEFLVLGLAAGDVIEFWNLRALLAEAEAQEVTSVLLVPGTRSAWMATTTEEGVEQLAVVDLDKRRVSRELPRRCFFFPVAGERETRVIVEKRTETSVTVHHPRGAPVLDLALPQGVAAAAVAPLGELVLLLGEVMPQQDVPEAFTLLRLDERGRVKGSTPIAGSNSVLQRALAPALERAHAFVAFGDNDDRRSLAAYSLAGPVPRETFRVGVPSTTTLAGDEAGQRAVALLDDGGQILVVPLGQSWPFRDRKYPRCADDIWTTATPYLCDNASSSLRAQASALWASLGAPPPEALRQAIAAHHERHADDPARLAAWCVMIERRGGLVEESGALARWAAGRHPRDPLLNYLAGRDAIRARDWSAAARFLAVGSLHAVPEDIALHRAHLLAQAYLGTGALTEARAVLHAAKRFDGLCRLEWMVPLTHPAEAFADRRRWGPGRPRAWQTVGAVRTADAALARGNLAKALDALDRPAVWTSSDLQVLARLADVFLRNGGPSPAARFRRLEACTRYHALRESQYASNLGLPGATWSQEQLDELAERCRAVLDPAGE